MADFLGMMKQAAQLQSKMQAMQDELGNVEVEGTSGGGLVAVRMTAKMDVKGVKIDPQSPCTVCTDPRRDPSIIVVVADVADLWALERANATQGRYHVLGATLSPLDGVGPQDLTIDALVARAHEAQVHEVILALNATVDGQTTAHYITYLLQDANVKVTRLAHGVPVGGELDYLDEGTLSAAMRQRTLF